MTRAVAAGNLHDKYGTRNPLARALVGRWRRTLDELLDRAGPATLLDFGCGEGVLAEGWASRPGVLRVLGLDVEDRRLREQWAGRARPGLAFEAVRPGAKLPIADRAYDVVAAIEVLEHVQDPAATLAELTRCARLAVLLSVPREPLWSTLNLARGAHWRSLGNTPGHRHRFSRRAFLELVGGHARTLETRAPAPWTVILAAPGRRAVPDAAAAAPSAYPAPAAAASSR